MPITGALCFVFLTKLETIYALCRIDSKSSIPSQKKSYSVQRSILKDDQKMKVKQNLGKNWPAKVPWKLIAPSFHNIQKTPLLSLPNLKKTVFNLKSFWTEIIWKSVILIREFPKEKFKFEYISFFLVVGKSEQEYTLYGFLLVALYSNLNPVAVISWLEKKWMKRWLLEEIPLGGRESPQYGFPIMGDVFESPS